MCTMPRKSTGGAPRSATRMRQPASSAMSASRSPGCVGSSGRYAPPAFSTPSIAATRAGERPAWRPTTTSRSTPSVRRRRASALARASSSAYVIRVVSSSTAMASGARAACASNTPCTVAGSGYASGALAQSTSTRRRSAGSSIGSAESVRVGSSATAASSAA